MSPKIVIFVPSKLPNNPLACCSLINFEFLLMHTVLLIKQLFFLL